MNIQLSRWDRAWAALVRFAPILAVIALAIFLPHNPDSLPVLGIGFAGAIMDTSTQFASKVALNTGAAGTYLIGDVIDLTLARDIGNGQPVYLVLSIDTTVTSAGAATVQFQLVSDSAAAIATDGSAIVHVDFEAIPKATLVAGYQAIKVLPLEFPAYKRFLGILQITGTAAVTAGKVNAYLTLDPPHSHTYPNAVNAI